MGRPSDPPQVVAMQSWLRARGYAETRDLYDARSFGNRLIEYERPPARVRVSMDRGDWAVEIAADGQDFMPVWLWRDLLEGHEPEDQAMSLDDQAATVTSHIGRIEDLCSPERAQATTKTLRDLGFRLAAKMFPGFPPPEGPMPA